MELKHKKVTTIVVEMEDLEEFIKEHLGVILDFMVVEDPYFDEDYDFVVGPHGERMHQAAMSIIRNMWVPGHSTGLLLDELCTRGLIEPGNYHIEAHL